MRTLFVIFGVVCLGLAVTYLVLAIRNISAASAPGQRPRLLRPHSRSWNFGLAALWAVIGALWLARAAGSR